MLSQERTKLSSLTMLRTGFWHAATSHLPCRLDRSSDERIRTSSLPYRLPFNSLRFYCTVEQYRYQVHEAAYFLQRLDLRAAFAFSRSSIGLALSAFFVSRSAFSFSAAPSPLPVAPPPCERFPPRSGPALRSHRQQWSKFK